MIKLESVIAKTKDRCTQKGAELHSRQLVSLAEVLVEEINLEFERRHRVYLPDGEYE